MSRPATFDHAECRALYATGDWSQKVLAKRFGVSQARINQVCNPELKARVDAAATAWVREHYNKPCAGGCGRRVQKRGNDPRQTGLCQKCLGESRRTAEHGTESRYSSGCRCDPCRTASATRRRERRHANLEATRAWDRAYKARRKQAA